MSFDLVFIRNNVESFEDYLRSKLKFRIVENHYWKNILNYYFGSKLQFNIFSKITLENISILQLMFICRSQIRGITYFWNDPQNLSSSVDILIMEYKGGYLSYDIRHDREFIREVKVVYSKTIEGLKINDEVLKTMINDSKVICFLI